MTTANKGRFLGSSLVVAIALALIGGCSAHSTTRDSSAVVAGTTGSAGYQASAASEQVEEKSEQLICRRERPTGSRISETICMTAEDWERIARGSQETIRQAQRAPKTYNDQ